MPNHCETDLYIRGEKEDIAAFAQWINEIEGREICRALIPYPEPFKTMDEEAQAFSFFNGAEDKEKRQAARDAYAAKYGHTTDGYNSGGYEWCNTAWGTKWGTYEIEFTPETRRGALLSFLSAWAPPSDAVFRALAEKFPNLTFEAEWFECGMSYCGGITFPSKKEAADFGLEHGAPQYRWSGEYHGSRGE